MTTSITQSAIGNIEVTWFNSMGALSEPIFSMWFITVTMKQLALLFGGLLLAYGLATVNPYAAISVAGVALITAFYKPRVMSVEEYIMAAIRFFSTRSSRTTEKKHIAGMFARSGAGAGTGAGNVNKVR
jgi:hypothetical protein